MTRARGLFTIVLLGLMVTGCASAPTNADSPTGTPNTATFGTLPTGSLDATVVARLDAVLDEVVANGRPDVIAAVVSAEGRWSGATGVDGPDGKLAGVDDEFSIASITKLFTATLIMRLVDEDAIDLDQPLSTYLGDIDADTNGATVRQALQMKSGIPDTGEQSFAKVASDLSHAWTDAEIAAEIPAPTTDAGGEYIYSNPTYKLLGFAAQNVLGTSLADAMRTRVLDPAGSPDTLRVQTSEAPLPEPWALPVSGAVAPVESFGVGDALPNLSDATFSAAGAGMAGTAPGVADWAWQLFAGRVVSLTSLHAMMTTTDSDGSGSGLDELASQNLPGAYGHSGSKDGYQSLLAVFPESQTVIVVFINQRDASVGGVAASLRDALAG
jgi:D-alanyl-D-alanine carboxypeptidase